MTKHGQLIKKKKDSKLKNNKRQSRKIFDIFHPISLISSYLKNNVHLTNLKDFAILTADCMH